MAESVRILCWRRIRSSTCCERPIREEKCGRKYKGAVRAVDDEKREPEPEMAQITNASVPEGRMY